MYVKPTNIFCQFSRDVPLCLTSKIYRWGITQVRALPASTLLPSLLGQGGKHRDVLNSAQSPFVSTRRVLTIALATHESNL